MPTQADDPVAADLAGSPPGATLHLRVIGGLFRSGTTYLGEVLRRTTRCPLIDEPLNVHRGMSGVLVAYPYVGANGGQYANLIDDVVALARPWNRRSPEHRLSVLKRAVRRTRSFEARLRWGGLRLAKRLGVGPGCLLWKDPFATLASPYLVRRHGARMVCMVRHPGAIHVSLQKQGWGFDIGYLRRQQELIDEYGCDILPHHWDRAARNSAVAVAILWKLMIRVNGDLSGCDERIRLVRHEDLCREPLRVTEAAASHLALKVNSSARQFLARHSGGDRAHARRGRPRDFMRDSLRLADAWRAEAKPEDEAAMREVIGDDLFRFYERW